MSNLIYVSQCIRVFFGSLLYIGRRLCVMINYTCGIWRPPFMRGPCIWWWSCGWYCMSMLLFALSMCWKCWCWWKLFVVGSSSICGREIVSSAGDGWREPGVRLKLNKQHNRLGKLCILSKLKIKISRYVWMETLFPQWNSPKENIKIIKIMRFHTISTENNVLFHFLESLENGWYDWIWFKICGRFH